MNSDFLISVITVCRNSAETLDRALRSVDAQDWSRVEHTIIDGASTDGSLEIIERYRAKIAHFVSEPDMGIYDAMNKGIERARGEIICFLNADDYYASNKVLSSVALKMSEKNLDALMGDVVFFNKGNPQRTVRHYRSDRFTPNRLAWGIMPAHPALFLRKHIVERVGRFKTDYRIAGDFEFIARTFFARELRYAYVPEVMVRMQTGGASAASLRSRVLLNQEVLRACRENGIKTNIFKILSKYPMKLMEMVCRS